MTAITQLAELLKTRDTNKITTFIERTPAVLSMKTEQGISGLLLIAYYQLPEVVEKILPLKKDLSIHEAAACGAFELVKQFLEKDPSLLNSIAPDGFPLLSLACYFGKETIATYLIEQGANVGLVATNGSAIQALHAAIVKNNSNICALLLAHGADVNAQQVQGVSPLHSAVHRGNFSIVELLVQKGADINASMDNGDTPLSIAKRENHQTILEYLNSKI